MKNNIKHVKSVKKWFKKKKIYAKPIVKLKEVKMLDSQEYLQKFNLQEVQISRPTKRHSLRKVTNISEST